MVRDNPLGCALVLLRNTKLASQWCMTGGCYLSGVLSDPQVPHCDSSLGVKVLARHVDIICIFILVFVLAVVFPFLWEEKKKESGFYCKRNTHTLYSIVCN